MSPAALAHARNPNPKLQSSRGSSSAATAFSRGSSIAREVPETTVTPIRQAHRVARQGKKEGFVPTPNAYPTCRTALRMGVGIWRSICGGRTGPVDLAIHGLDGTGSDQINEHPCTFDFQHVLVGGSDRHSYAPSPIDALRRSMSRRPAIVMIGICG